MPGRPNVTVVSVFMRKTASSMTLWLLVYSNPAGRCTRSSMVLTSPSVKDAVSCKCDSVVHGPTQSHTTLPLTTIAEFVHGTAGSRNRHVGLFDVEPLVVFVCLKQDRM